jgi:hypothetical protein
MVQIDALAHRLRPGEPPQCTYVTFVLDVSEFVVTECIAHAPAMEWNLAADLMAGRRDTRNIATSHCSHRATADSGSRRPSVWLDFVRLSACDCIAAIGNAPAEDRRAVWSNAGGSLVSWAASHGSTTA